LSTKDVLGTPQADVLVAGCERVGRVQDFDAIEGNAEKYDQSEPLPPIRVRHEHAKSDGNEDEKQTEPEEHGGLGVPVSVTTLCVTNYDRSKT
jgi:hypothetical protein